MKTTLLLVAITCIVALTDGHSVEATVNRIVDSGRVPTAGFVRVNALPSGISHVMSIGPDGRLTCTAEWDGPPPIYTSSGYAIR